MHTRSDSQIPWDKVSIDYLGTQECGGELGKVLFGDGVGALRGSSALNSIQNYTKIINTVLI